MSEKQNTESTEIIWKLTYKHDSLLLKLWIVILWSFRICVLCGSVWIFYIAIQKLYESFGKDFWGIAPFVVISLLFAVVVFGYLMAILRTLNTKIFMQQAKH